MLKDAMEHPGGLESGSPESPVSTDDGGNCPTDRLTSEQSKLILDHFELAGRVAERLSKRHQSSVSDGVDGMVYEALCIAAQRYDASRGVPFEPYFITFAGQQVVDALRSNGPVSRMASRTWKTTRDNYPSWSPGMPISGEAIAALAELLDIRESTVHAHLNSVIPPTRLDSYAPAGKEGDIVSLAEAIPDRKEDDNTMERRAVALRELLELLNTDEVIPIVSTVSKTLAKAIGAVELRLCEFKDDEAGEMMGVTGSMVCQLRKDGRDILGILLGSSSPESFEGKGKRVREKARVLRDMILSGELGEEVRCCLQKLTL